MFRQVVQRANRAVSRNILHRTICKPVVHERNRLLVYQQQVQITRPINCVHSHSSLRMNYRQLSTQIPKVAQVPKVTRIQHIWTQYIKNKKFLVGLSVGSAAAMYLYFNSEIVSFNKSKYKFDKTSYTYEAKKKIFLGMPEPKFTPTNTKEPQTIEDWARLVNIIISNIDNTIIPKEKLVIMNFINKFFNRMYHSLIYENMRQSLIKQINDFPELETRLREYKLIVPDSMELRSLIESQLQAELDKNEWLDINLITSNIPQSRTPYSMEIKLMRDALLVFKRPIDLIRVLKDNMDVSELIQNFEVAPDKLDSVITSINGFKTLFQKKSIGVQNYILEEVISTLINKMKETTDGTTLYNNLVNEQLFTRLQRDPQIGQITNHLSTVFMALPVRMQAKMLYGSLNKFSNDIDLISSLLNAAGIVAIKLGQIMSEDPKLPVKYRKRFSKLRDTNEPVGILDIIETIPPTMLKEIGFWGKLVGTGSVKQVHKVKLIGDDTPYSIACIRNGVEDDIIAVFKALNSIPQIKGFVNRTRKLICHEVNLWLEAEAFDYLRNVFAENNIDISVPRVKHVSSHCLVRELADGSTLAKIFKHKKLADSQMNILMTKLEELHRSAINIAFSKGFIMSDLHLGNIAFEDSNKLNIFDPGQNDTLTGDEPTVLLWMFAALSDSNRMKQFKSIVVEKIASIARHNLNNSEMQTAINRAYDSCNNIVDPKFRCAQVLIALGDEGIILPDGFTSYMKGVDILMSQEKLLHMPDIVGEEIEKLLRERMTYGEMIRIGLSKLI